MMLLYVAMALNLVCFMAVIGSAWSMYCAKLTGDDRLKAIEPWRHRPMSWHALCHAYEAVTFGQHYRARLLCRDPWALYDPIVLDSIKNPRTEVIGMMTGELSQDGPPVVH